MTGLPPTVLTVVNTYLRPIAINVGIGGQVLQDLSLEELHEFIPGNLHGAMVSLHSQVTAHDLPPETVEARKTFTIEAPATWWQHLKETHASTWWLGWLARWRPPVMNTARRVEGHLVVNLKRFRVYPDAPPLANRLGRGYEQHVVDDAAWWKDRDADA